jgi:hypothetical protein
LDPRGTSDRQASGSVKEVAMDTIVRFVCKYLGVLVMGYIALIICWCISPA